MHITAVFPTTTPIHTLLCAQSSFSSSVRLYNRYTKNAPKHSRGPWKLTLNLGNWNLFSHCGHSTTMEESFKLRCVCVVPITGMPSLRYLLWD